MITKWPLALVAVFGLVQIPNAASAFACPKHFEAAQALIDKVKGDMGGDMSKQMPKDQMALVHALLDDANMRLAGAKHNHEKPQGIYDHARAASTIMPEPSPRRTRRSDTPGPPTCCISK